MLNPFILPEKAKEKIKIVDKPLKKDSAKKFLFLIFSRAEFWKLDIILLQIVILIFKKILN